MPDKPHKPSRLDLMWSAETGAIGRAKAHAEEVVNEVLKRAEENRPERKCENCGNPATHTGEFSEGNESGGRVDICWRCAVAHRCHNVRAI